MLGEVKLDLARMQARKGEVVARQHQGRGVPVQEEQDHLDQGRCEIHRRRTTIDGRRQGLYAPKSIVIATGSNSVPLKGVEVDEKRIVTSTGALELDKVPGHWS